MQVHIMLCDATDMISYLVGKQVSKMDQRGFDCKLGQNYPGVVRNRCCASTVCTLSLGQIYSDRTCVEYERYTPYALNLGEEC